MTRKWRPPLALVIGGTLLALLTLPLVAIAGFRVAGNILGWGETSILLGTMALLATALLALLLWRLVLRPVWALTDYARALRRGEDADMPPQYGTPEMFELGEAVTGMSATLQARATSLRAYADHVTHELRSPLTTLRGAAEMLQDGPDPDTRDALVASIDASAARMEHLLDTLQRHTKATQSTGPGRSRLSDVLGDLPAAILSDTPLPLSTTDLHTILEHLVQNAHAHGAHKVTLSSNGQELDVIDDGAGIREGDRARVFDPFFTTRREEGGTGMGLSIVQSLLSARGARIALCPTEKGAHFRITFLS